MSCALLAGLAVGSISLVTAVQPTEHSERLFVRKEAKQADVSRKVLEVSTNHMKEWEADHPPLLSPWFWFWGRPCRNKVGVGGQLLENPVLLPPSQNPYNLSIKDKIYYSQWSQDRILEPILGNISNGFFVESGALDGETNSNTLYYEMKHGWSGLLIEPTNSGFAAIKTKHRNAFAFHGCLSPDGKAKTVEFVNDDDTPGLGSIVNNGNRDTFTGNRTLFRTETQPLHALLDVVGQRSVDFWSLDIEGSEGAVLMNTDFSKVEVGVLLVEMNKNGENNNQVKEAMDNAGFKRIGHSIYDGGVLDHIFINPQYFAKRNLPEPNADVLEVQYRDESNPIAWWNDFLGSWLP